MPKANEGSQSWWGRSFGNVCALNTLLQYLDLSLFVNNIVLNNISSNNLNETSTNVNGNPINDDAVVASSTIRNSVDSITALDEKKIQ